MLKLFEVTFNDGRWHTSLPTMLEVAENKEIAIKQAKNKHTYYEDWEVWATEIKVDGYDIIVVKKEV